MILTIFILLSIVVCYSAVFGFWEQTNKPPPASPSSRASNKSYDPRAEFKKWMAKFGEGI